MTIAARKEALEAIISDVVGAKVEMTIRGKRGFTFSTEEVNRDLEARLKDYFGAAMVITDPTEIDEECGTFVYMAAA
jgi:hypothetical protein